MRLEPSAPADVLAAIRAPLEGAGAERADAPLLQPLSLLLDLAGETMRAQLFVVQAEGAAEECLRPDFTVAIAQQHIASRRTEGRYVYEGPAFRASPGDAGAEQFVQLGLEHFHDRLDDVTGPDVQIAALAWRAAAAGGRDDLSLWLGDVALFAAFLDSLALAPALAARLKRIAGRPRLLQAELARAGALAPAETGRGQLASLLSGLGEPQAAALLEEVWSLAGVERVGGRGAAEIAARLVRRAHTAQAPALGEGEAGAIRAFMAIDDAPQAAFRHVATLSGPDPAGLRTALEAWRRRIDGLAATVPAERLRFAPALGHAFDYYDGLTFEVRSDALGPERPAAVGGRYDGLLARLGGSGLGGAVGCMVRPWRAYAGGEA